MKYLLFSLFMISVLATVSSCKEKSKSEKLKDALEQSKDDAEKTAKEVKDAVEEAVD